MRVKINSAEELEKMIGGLSLRNQAEIDWSDTKTLIPPGMPASSTWTALQQIAARQNCDAINEAGLQTVVFRRKR